MKSKRFRNYLEKKKTGATGFNESNKNNIIKKDEKRIKQSTRKFEIDEQESDGSANAFEGK